MIGIYFLLHKKKVVYVGQSINLSRRTNEHKDKKYDSIRTIECDSSSLNLYEKRWIFKFQPRYNKVGLIGKQTKYLVRMPIKLWIKIRKSSNKNSRSVNGEIVNTLREKFDIQ